MMGETTKIQWCDSTWNAWLGCSPVSAGCDNCYAKRLMDTRLGKAKWGPGGTRVRTSAAYWRQPDKWDAQAKVAGVRRRVFCDSLCDIFEDRPELVDWRFDCLRMALDTPNLDHLVLTKRPENIPKMLIHNLPFNYSEDDMRFHRMLSDWLVNGTPPANIWLGVSVEDQETANKRIPKLLEIPAAIHFVSYEPALGPVDFRPFGKSHCEACTYVFDGMLMGGHHVVSVANQCEMLVSESCGPTDYEGIDWVICGGESGPKARPMNPEWARDVRDQCQSASVPFFMKQMAKKGPIPEDLMIRQFPAQPAPMRSE